MLRIDLNCDLGEGAGRDADLMPWITSANIACGAHAGDDRTIRETLTLAAQHHIAAGAHPGYPDREGFGRHRMDMTPGEIYETVAKQIGTFCDAARELGVPVAHVKPHGALYNDAAGDAHVARAVVRAVRDASPTLLLYGLSGSRIITEAELVGVRAVPEAFADRGYEQDGTLTPRDAEGAVLDDPEMAAARVLRLVADRVVRTTAGADIRLHAETVCIHGDGRTAVAIAARVRAVLLEAGVRIAAPGAA
ncbi:MAG TPA: 5-oxoprolinase subunit PxpA [Longimicrobiales bacterium]|nr:5-oxoprolinase subunit PxpA [Longimicrobiales bacterium]